MEISSIIEVTDFKTGHKEQVTVTGVGQTVFNYLRPQYSKFSKFVLRKFMVNGEIKKVNLRTYNNVR